MRKILVFALAMMIWASVHADSTIRLDPAAQPSGNFVWEVKLDTSYEVVALKFTVEYDSTQVRYVVGSTQLGSAIPPEWMGITHVNENVGGGAQGQGMNRNVLVQIFGDGGDTWFTGSNQQLATFEFATQPGCTGTNTVQFDMRCNVTSLSVWSNNQLITSCEELTGDLFSNPATVTCSSGGGGCRGCGFDKASNGTWSAIKGLYR